jgi:hypothetical protein
MLLEKSWRYPKGLTSAAEAALVCKQLDRRHEAWATGCRFFRELMLAL